MSWLILVHVWLVISVATATRGFSGGGMECYSVLVLIFFTMDTIFPTSGMTSGGFWFSCDGRASLFFSL